MAAEDVIQLIAALLLGAGTVTGIVRAKRRQAVRIAEITALAKAATPEAVIALGAALNDVHAAIRNAAADAQTEIHRRLVEIGRADIHKLSAWLRHDNLSLKLTAIRALSEIQDVQAARSLAPLLGDRDYGVRSATAEALASIGAPAQKPLLALLQDADERCREGAAALLPRVGVPVTHPALATYHRRAQEQRKKREEELGEPCLLCGRRSREATMVPNDHMRFAERHGYTPAYARATDDWKREITFRDQDWRLCSFCMDDLTAKVPLRKKDPLVRCRLCGAMFDLTPFVGSFNTFIGEKTECAVCGAKGVYFADIQEVLRRFQS